MGGTIKVAVRFPDGEISCNNRWTNPLPYWIRHPKLIASDVEHLRSYVDKPSDYNGDTRLAPDGYGLVVVDMATQTVFTMNGYSNFVETILADRDIVEQRFGVADNDADSADVFREMLEGGRLRVVKFPIGGGEPEIIPLACKADEFNAAIDPYRDDLTSAHRTHYSYLGIDYSPWQIKILDEEDDDGMRQALLDAGFTLSETDETGWAEWKKRFE